MHTHGNSGYEKRGNELPLFSASRNLRHETGLCDQVAALWARCEPEAHAAMMEALLRAARVHVAPAFGTGAIEVIREQRWFTSEEVEHDQRMDLVFLISGWGRVVIEAKVRQAYWHASGPLRFPEYAMQLAIEGERAREQNLCLLALTPFAIRKADLGVAPARVRVGALTWLGLVDAWLSCLGERFPVARMLVKELAGLVRQASLGLALEEVPVEQISDMRTALAAVRHAKAAAGRFLEAIAHEGEGLGLTLGQAYSGMDAGIDDPHFTQPFAWWAVPGLDEEDFGIAVVFRLDLAELWVLITRCVNLDTSSCSEVGAKLLPMLIPQPNLHFVRWEAQLSTMPATAAGAAELDATPISYTTSDYDNRGLGLVLRLDEGQSALGPTTLGTVLEMLRTQVPGLLALVSKVDVPEDMPRPAPSVVDELMQLDDQQLIAGADPTAWAYAWTRETAGEFLARWFIRADGKPAFRISANMTWNRPVKTRGAYVSLDRVPRCCGARITKPTNMRKPHVCPVCGTRVFWMRDVQPQLDALNNSG